MDFTVEKIDDEIADGDRRRFELGFFLFVFGFDGENAILAVEIDSHFVSFVVGRTVNATSPGADGVSHCSFL